MRSVVEAPSQRDFLATNRGGGLYSEAVSQPLGAAIAVVAARLGLAPTVLTLANLALGLAASLAVIASAGTEGERAAGLVALVGWQVAYAFDCADGQLARVTNRTSSAGARLDVLCDIAVQTGLVAALGTVAVAHRTDTPAWLIAAFAGTWMVNLVTSIMQTGPNAASLITSWSLPVRLVKLTRDYGAVIAVAGLVLAIAPQWTIGVLWAFTIVNGGFLLASIVHSARAALRR